MNQLVIDIGCSKTKFFVFENDRQCELWWQPTPTDINTLLADVKEQYTQIRDMAHYHFDSVIVLSYSDSIVAEGKNGRINDISWKVQQLHKVYADRIPPYTISGKPVNSELSGMAMQLVSLQEQYGLNVIKRILPVSTFAAAELAGDLAWNQWDITHASNSGMWDHLAGYWASEMEPFLEAGVIGEKVVKPSETVVCGTGTPILIGGHDSVFANANDVPYSSKPYLSVGTWVTASIESYFEKRDTHSRTRFVCAPNGTTLEQLCFHVDAGHDLAYDRTIDFFEERMPSNAKTHYPVINIFGGWSEESLRIWGKHPYLKFQRKDTDKTSWLHQQAAKYAREAVVGEHVPASAADSPNTLELGSV